MQQYYFDNQRIYEALESYVSSPNFKSRKHFYHNSPYIRPVRPQDINTKLLDNYLTEHQLTNSEHLLTQRILLNIYEQDLMFLPINSECDKTSKRHWAEYRQFYNHEHVALGKLIKPILERKVFGWLEDKVDINGPWTIESFISYTDSVLQDIKKSDSSLFRELTTSKEPIHACNMFLIQCAGDFLSEASAMGRNVLGSYGSHTSELFKIFLDEYGHGVHEKKHSTLFEDLLKDAGLNTGIHYYWEFYYPTSISLINYFHYVSANHDLFYRYIGAMYFTEASLAWTTRDQSKTIRTIYKGEVSSQYFDEHSHIDVHHGRMALKNLIEPLVKEYGEQILPEILRGFEEFRLLQDKADAELFKHINWYDNIDEYKEKAAAIRLKGKNLDSKLFTESKGEVSTTHTHSHNEIFSVEDGEIEIILTPDKTVRLNKGESILIPMGMLHGSKVVSESCTYQVSSLDDDF